MSKLLGLSSLKSFDQFKLLSGSASGAAKTLSISSRASSDSVSFGSFANLKLTAGFSPKILATLLKILEFLS